MIFDDAVTVIGWRTRWIFEQANLNGKVLSASKYQVSS